MLDPQHLRSFQEIARSGSYSAAAAKLGYTQPALSYQMRSLERVIGTPLTARAGRSVRLTPAGQTLLRHADQILTAIRVAERDLAAVVGSGAGAVRIATFDSAGATLVPQALTLLSRERPAVDVRVVHTDPADARAMVLRGDADVAVTYHHLGDDNGAAGSTAPEPTTRGRSPLATVPLLVDHVHLVLPVAHPVAQSEVVGLAALADEQWLIGGALFAETLQRAAARAGFAARITSVADDYVAMQSLVARGVGVALLPGLTLLAHRHPDVAALALPWWPARRIDLESWPDLLRVPSVAALAHSLEASASETVGRPEGRGLVSVPAPVEQRRAAPRAAERSAPWHTWFELTRRTLPRAARDRGDRAIVLSDESGTTQVHTWRRRAATFPQLTTHPGGVALADISADGEQVWWLADTSGDEFGVWMVQDFGGGPARVAAPGMPAGFSGGLALGSRRSVVARSDSDGAEVFVVETPRSATAPRVRRIYAHPQFAAVGALSTDDELVAITHSEHGDAQKPAIRVLHLDRARGEPAIVGELWDGNGLGVWPLAFSPIAGSSELLVLHERHGRTMPMIWDPLTSGQREIDPQLAGETIAWWFPNGEALLLLHQLRGRSELYRTDVTSGRTTRVATERGHIAEAAALPDGSVDYLWSSSRDAPRVLNTASDAAVIPTVDTPPAPALEDVTVAGSAGDIHVLVARPADAGHGPNPTVLMVHGGPAAHDADAFSPTRNAWTASGYTVVHVNYRGSSGYGAEWRNANIGRPGRAELEDVVAARDAIVASGTSDPDRLIIAGESWGGYLALLALGLYPALWALGIAMVPVADTAAVYDDMMEEIRAAYRVRFGGSPTEVPDVYAGSSPLSVVGDVTAPVLVTGGLHDTRCPIRQIELYVSRLVELGKQHEFHRFDWGHEPRTRADRIHQVEVMLAFARRHLGPV